MQNLFDNQTRTNEFTALRKRHLAEFLALVKVIDVRDATQFSDMMYAAFRWYGLSAVQLATDLMVSRSAVSKWCGSTATPTHPTRKAVWHWIQAEITKQL